MASRTGQRFGNGRAAAPNEIIINVGAGETRVAILEQQTFAELHIERERERSVAGMVVKGRVTRVLPGMQAAFVDIGLEKAAFLYVGDYLDEEGHLDPDVEDEEGARPRRGRGRHANRPIPNIETVLREGQEIIVQVAKEPIGSKGARITSHVSIAGRHLVLTPWAKRVGVSRRIDSDRERRRLREVVARLSSGKLGFIIRTAGEGTSEADLEADVNYLSSVWEQIQERRDRVSAPTVLFEELALPLRAIRDFANSRTRRIAIDDPDTYRSMQEFLARFVADPKPQLELYTGALPIFDHFGIEVNIDENLGRKVWLRSGGYLIIDQSEALTSIDVNTGRYVGKRDLEETVLKTNLEAVQEVVHQLRFRNIGGLIIIDLIDMESAENREKVHRALQEALREDKAKTNLLKISELGLVEMTRKRTRENLVQQLCEPCSYCDGRGYVISAESVAYKVLREIRKDLPRFCGRQIAVSVNPRVAEMLLGPARRATQRLSGELGREIEIRARPGLHQEQFEVVALDRGPAVEIPLGWLGERERRTAAGGRMEGGSRAPAEESAALPKAVSGLDSPGGSSGDVEPQLAEADAEPGAKPDSEPALAVDVASENPIIPRLQIGEDS
ncbi:MAG TPA: Rne/Rng family ribonuclease [Myxococcota bacterium]|nr:Rne/Rng family ribonuclease [Myxococcota bacterium]